jgi:glucose/mannose-6-phosphate isomerase
MKYPEFCRDALRRAEKIRIPKKVEIRERVNITYLRPKNIIVSGMGGSSVGGEILRDWLRATVPIPIDVNRDYDLPAYADKDTLVFVVSYSGNTEETLASFVEAIKRRCMTIAITSGGHLLSLSERLSLPHVKIPRVLAPRVAIPYLFFPLPILLEKMGLSLEVEEEIEEAIMVLEELRDEIGPKTPTEANPSKRLALNLVGTIPVVYGFREYRALARRLKTQFNENSKIPSKHDVFPELKHNEVSGWEAPDSLTRQFSFVLLRGRHEPAEIQHSIEATKLLAIRKKTFEIYSRGDKKLARMFSILQIGDFTTIYLAILQEKDPRLISNIASIKEETRRRLNSLDGLLDEVQRITDHDISIER